jgi:hypothetical protein
LINKSVSQLIDLGAAFQRAIGTPGAAESVATAKGFMDFLNSKIDAIDPSLPDVLVNVAGGDIRFSISLARTASISAFPSPLTSAH